MQTTVGIIVLAFVGAALAFVIRRARRTDEKPTVTNNTIESEPEQQLELVDALRVIITSFEARPVMEQELIFRLAYAICGFGPCGKLVMQRAQGCNADIWAWFYRSFVPVAGLPDESDDRHFEHLTGRYLDDMLRDPLVVLCLVHFGGFLKKINHELIGYELRNSIPGLAETTTAYGSFDYLNDLAGDYDRVPAEHRTFFDDQYPERVDLPLVRATDPVNSDTGQLFMTPRERLGLAILGDFADDKEGLAGIVTLSVAICGFGPEGTHVQAVAQKLRFANRDEYDSSVRCVMGLPMGAHVNTERFMGDTWFLGEVGFYAAYLSMVYYALSEERRSSLLGQDHQNMEDVLQQFVSLSATFFPQYVTH